MKFVDIFIQNWTWPYMNHVKNMDITLKIQLFMMCNFAFIPLEDILTLKLYFVCVFLFSALTKNIAFAMYLMEAEMIKT